jgi:hypothetical protein
VAEEELPDGAERGVHSDSHSSTSNGNGDSH